MCWKEYLHFWPFRHCLSSCVKTHRNRLDLTGTGEETSIIGWRLDHKFLSSLQSKAVLTFEFTQDEYHAVWIKIRSSVKHVTTAWMCNYTVRGWKTRKDVGVYNMYIWSFDSWVVKLVFRTRVCYALSDLSISLTWLGQWPRNWGGALKMRFGLRCHQEIRDTGR